MSSMYNGINIETFTVLFVFFHHLLMNKFAHYYLQFCNNFIDIRYSFLCSS